MPDDRSSSSPVRGSYGQPKGEPPRATDQQHERSAQSLLLRSKNTELSATKRSIQRWISVVIGFGVLSWACEPQTTTCVVSPAETPELDGTRLLQALAALESQLGENAELIELRATGNHLSLQVVQTQPTDVQADPAVPHDDRADLRVLEFRYDFAHEGATEGQLRGPTQLPLLGVGAISDNAFPLRELDIARITQAFPLAQKAVDPLDGKVRELVVRRFLPFHRSVRARIFVESPRMNGSIDTNASGAPLKP